MVQYRTPRLDETISKNFDLRDILEGGIPRGIGRFLRRWEHSLANRIEFLAMCACDPKSLKKKMKLSLTRSVAGRIVPCKEGLMLDLEVSLWMPVVIFSFATWLTLSMSKKVIGQYSSCGQRCDLCSISLDLRVREVLTTSPFVLFEFAICQTASWRNVNREEYCNSRSFAIGLLVVGDLI